MAKNFIYKEKKEELEKILSELQSPNLDLEEAIVKYKVGTSLIKEIEEYLDKTKNKITELKTNLEI